MSLKSIKIFFLSLFREFFVHHHKSLEFRAKLFAAMISSNKDEIDCEYDVLKQVATDIYKDDEYRVDVLVNTTKEYVNKILKNNTLDIDRLLIDIDKDVKRHKRFKDKINMTHLRSFYGCSSDEDTLILQTRILEFFENEIKYSR